MAMVVASLVMVFVLRGHAGRALRRWWLAPPTRWSAWRSAYLY